MRYEILRVTLCLLSSTLLVGSFAPVGAEKPGVPPVAVAARAGDWVLTYDDLDRSALSRDTGQFRGLRLRDAIHEARKLAIEALIEDHLLDVEAARAGLSKGALLDREARATAVSEEQVRKWYDANQGRLKGAPFEKAAPDVRRFLEGQQRQEARQALVNRLRTATSVSVLLEPPREPLHVTDDEPAAGPRSAPIEVVMYSDFQCPYCAKVEATVAKLKEAYGDRLRVVFRDFPLKAIHQQAVPAAIAARCAHEQGRFWEYHDRLFANQAGFSQARFEEHAAALGLDMVRFRECQTSPRIDSIVNQNVASGERLGVTGTPAFFINGRFVGGAQPYQVFARIIDEELITTSRKQEREGGKP